MGQGRRCVVEGTGRPVFCSQRRKCANSGPPDWSFPGREFAGFRVRLAEGLRVQSLSGTAVAGNADGKEAGETVAAKVGEADGAPVLPACDEA